MDSFSMKRNDFYKDDGGPSRLSLRRNEGERLRVSQNGRTIKETDLQIGISREQQYFYKRIMR